jgi:flagellar hook protein FlgE
MLRSLFSGISGLRTHQQMIDVTGNNISNVNTTGFKSSQTIFQDTLSQLVKAAGAPQGGNGGTNPAQVGLGSVVAGIETNFGQGAAQTTGRSTDLMIQGDGFFVVKDGDDTLYTRNGSFSFDANGLLVTSGGKVVQGWSADDAGVINNNATPGPMKLPQGTLLAPTETTETVFGGNLPGDSPVGTAVTTSMTVYDEMGAPSSLTATITKIAPDPLDPTTARWAVSFDGGTTVADTLEFDAAGELSAPADGIIAFSASMDVDFSGITAFAGSATVRPMSQNGASMGSLQAFTISQDGTLQGVFSNGLKKPLGQLTLATFNNPPGLQKAGESMFRNTVNSGPAALGAAGSGGRGVLQAGALEMSNVDLAQEFTNLVIAQRGFQANSRVITTSDELLQDLVNLKR